MAKLIILGAGVLQVPIIKYAKSQNNYVIVISPRGNYPGFDYANKAYFHDVRDKEQILKIAKSENIDGIVTDQTDLPVTTAAYVAEELGLPGIGYHTSQLFTDKSRMNKKCIELGFSVPRSHTVSSMDEALRASEQLPYPFIIKPHNNQGSRGVVKIVNEDELRKNFEFSSSFSSENKVLMEEFIEGDEIAVQGLVYEYKTWNLLCVDKVNFENTNVFAPKYVMHPPKKQFLTDRLFEINAAIMKGFGLKHGLTQSEFVYSEPKDTLYFIETAARGAGAYISSHIIPAACNIDTSKFLLDLSLGNPVDTKNFKESAKHAGYISFYLNKGRIKEVKGLKEVLSLKEVIFFPYQKLNPGYESQGLTDKTSRLGPIIMVAESREIIEQTIEIIRNTLIISMEDGSGIIWD